MEPISMLTNQPYHDLLFVDYNINQSVGRFPPFFSLMYPAFAPANADLIDPRGNVHSIKVEKIGSDFFFTTGWYAFGRFYGITVGAWIRLNFIAPRTFNFTIMDYHGIAWTYPPMPDPVDLDIEIGPWNQEDIHKDLLLANNQSWTSTFVKWVSFSEYTGDVLTISESWAAVYLPVPEVKINIIDEFGNRWPCSLRRVEGTEEVKIILTGGWARFCRSKAIKQMQIIKFGVTRKTSYQLHYIPQV